MAHVGFPGIAQVNGELMIVYRDGPQHDVDTGATRGIIYRETSSDGGSTWGTRTAVVDDSGTQYDARDPTMLVTSADTVLVFYALAQSSTVFNPKVARSTNNGSSWTQIAITNSFTDYALASGQACEAANGDILCPMYGEDTGDTFTSARVSKSSDDGATWSHLADVGDGQADSRHYGEPALLRLPNDDIICFMRSDTANQLYKSTSTDDGATWSAPAVVAIANASGRPAPLLLSNGSIALWYRHPNNIRLHCVRFSSDSGATWGGQMIVSRTAQAVYAQMTEVSSGVIGIAYGDESNSTTSQVEFTYLLTGETDEL